MSTRLRAVAWLTAAAVAGVSCGDSLGIEDIPGVWEGMSVNGVSLPGSVPINVGSGTEIIEIDYDRLTFYDGNTCIVNQSVEDIEFTSDECEWVLDVDAKQITVELFDSYAASGAVNGGTMTMNWPNEGGDPNIAVYRKQ